MKNYVLHSIDWKSDKEPTIKEVASKLKIKVSDFDSNFGVVLVDPNTKTYCFMIDQKVLNKIQGNEELEGPFSNPSIEPFDIQ